MMQRLAWILILFLVVPAAALGTDLTLSLDGDSMYDSNVFRRENNIDDDVLFHIRPGIELHEDRGQDVNYSLKYEMPVRFAVQNSNRLNDIDHVADGDIRYHVNDRLDLFASNGFRYLRNTVQLALVDTGSAATGQGTPILSTSVDRVTLNDARIGATYRFAPRLTGNLTGESRYFNTTQFNRQDNWSASGSGDLQYTLTSRHIVGLGGRYFHTKFQPSETVVGSTSDTYNAFARWRYQVTETLAFSVAAGPSVIHLNQQASDTQLRVANQVPLYATGGPFGSANQLSSCPVDPVSMMAFIPNQGCDSRVPLSFAQAVAISGLNSSAFTIANNSPGDSSTNVTVFAEAAVSQRWTPNLASALRYERSQGNASGLGGLVTVDAVSGATTWDITERWQLALRGDWTHRKSVADILQVVGLASEPASLAGSDIAGFSGTAASVVAADSRIETNRWGVAARLTHRVWRNTSVFAQAAYNEQDSKTNTLGGFSDFRDFLGTVGVHHVFEPIKIW
jgi:hypothetical protein